MATKRLSGLMLGRLLAMVFITMAAGPGYGKTVEMTYSIFFPATHANTILAGDWRKEIEKQTNGAVKIRMFPGATLTPAD